MSKKLRKKIQAAIRNAHLLGRTYSIPGNGYPHQRPWLKYKVRESSQDLAVSERKTKA